MDLRTGFAGRLNASIVIERPVAGTSFTSAGSGSWERVAGVFAEIQDVLPSRDETLSDGIRLATRRARVRIRWRQGITPAMRFVWGDRIMQIVAGPAEIGRRAGLEFMVEDYSSAGNAA